MPPVRTYQGKRCSKRPNGVGKRPVQKDSDPFDQLIFGPRRSPHGPFSSSSEASASAIPTPSPGPSREPLATERRECQFFDGLRELKDSPNSLDSKSKPKSKFRKPKKNSPSLFTREEGFCKLLKGLKSRKKAGEHLGVDIGATSTPVARVHRKRVRGVQAGQSLCSRNNVLAPNLDESLVQSPNISAIQSSFHSPFGKIPRLLMLEETAKSSGIPPRTSMDSITNKLLQMNLAATVPLHKDEDLSRRGVYYVTQEDRKSVSSDKPLPNTESFKLQADASSAFQGSSSIPTHMFVPTTVAPSVKDLKTSRRRISDGVAQDDGESVLLEQTLPNVEASNLQADESSAFLGFSSIASVPTHRFLPPTSETLLYQPSPNYVARRRPRVLSSEARRFTEGVWSNSMTVPSVISNVGASHCGNASPDYSKGLGSRLDELDGTSTIHSSTVADNSSSNDFIIRRRNLQRASEHVTNDNVTSLDSSHSEDSLVDPITTSKRVSREDSGLGEPLENVAKRRQHPPTRDAAILGGLEIPSPDDSRSVIDSSSESLLSRSSRRGSGAGIFTEDVAKRRQLLRTMDPTKRDSGDIASPESSHSGVDSSNESALEEVGISHPKRLSGLKEGSSSGTSLDDFCPMDSVPSSPERATRNLSVRTMDRSNFRRRSFNELVPSPRSSLRDDFMSSSEDENDEEGYGDISSRPSDVALYPFYEPSLLEPLHENVERLDDDDENSSLSSESSKKSPVDTLDSNRTPNMRRKASLHSEEKSPTGRSNIGRASLIPELVSVIEEDSFSSDSVAPLEQVPLEHFVLHPGKKYRRSLVVIQNAEAASETDVQKGRKYNDMVEAILRLQTSQYEAQVETPVQVIRKRISLRRSSWIKQITPPPRRRLSLLAKTPDRSSVTLETPASLRLPLRLTNKSLADRTLHRPSPVQYNDASNVESSRERILGLCQQTQVLSFTDILPPESYEDCCKLGEGVYGEVFLVKRKDAKTVLKIIPVEGTQYVNDAPQKTYHEMEPELVIAKELHNLRLGASNGANKAGGFAEVVDMKLVKGCYPTELLNCWDEFDRVKGSENDRPQMFQDSQQFVILEQGNAGTPMEDYKFQSANTALSVFKQIAFSMAVAESAYEFEHRDLHWGNVLISRTTERQLSYIINSKAVTVAANGVKGTIIDYTLSRMRGPIFNDLSKDPELFIGSGDFQFDVYRHMKKDVNNEWSQFQPKTNARWLHYILDKLLNRKKYSRNTAKVHKDSMKVMRMIESWIDACSSARDVADKLAEM